MNKQATFKTLLCAAIIMAASHFAMAQTGYFGTYFIDTATAGSILFDHSVITHASIDSDSNAIFLTTPNWTSGNSIYDSNATGVYYIPDSGKWAVYNENLNHFQQGTAYNIVVPTRNGTAFKHKAGSVSHNFADIDNPATNGNRGALVFVTHNWGQYGDSSNIYENTPIGVWYDVIASKWSIYNERTLDTMPVQTEFNVFVADTTGGSAFTHVSTAANTLGNFTLINSPLTNGNTQAVIIVTHNYSGGPAFNRDSVPLGVFYRYDSARWGIFHQDGSPMQIGQSYNVLIAGISTTGIENVPAAEMHFKAYPNPAADHIAISYMLKENSAVTIKLYSSDGKDLGTIYEGKGTAGDNTMQYSTSALAAGSYYISLKTNDHSACYPIVIMR